MDFVLFLTSISNVFAHVASFAISIAIPTHTEATYAVELKNQIESLNKPVIFDQQDSIDCLIKTKEMTRFLLSNQTT